MNRKEFIKRSSAATLGGIILPTIVPSSVFGKNAPNSRINVGMIGVGRQAVSANLKNGFLKLNCRYLCSFPNFVGQHLRSTTQSS